MQVENEALKEDLAKWLDQLSALEFVTVVFDTLGVDGKARDTALFLLAGKLKREGFTVQDIEKCITMKEGALNEKV